MCFFFLEVFLINCNYSKINKVDIVEASEKCL